MCGHFLGRVRVFLFLYFLFFFLYKFPAQLSLALFGTFKHPKVESNFSNIFSRFSPEQKIEEGYMADIYPWTDIRHIHILLQFSAQDIIAREEIRGLNSSFDS